MEIIFGFVKGIDNRIDIRNQKIQLSNKYIINMIEDKENEGEYNGIEIKEKNNIYEGFFASNIKDINILVGTNGIGKTTILNLLGTDREHRKGNKYNWHFFWLYKLGDKYILEGNYFKTIKGFIKINKSQLDSIDDEFSLICNYNKESKKFEFISLCSARDEFINLQKILYYQDSSTEDMKWSMSHKRDAHDYAICFEREYVEPKLEEIYEYTCNISRMEHDIFKKKKVYGEVNFIKKNNIIWSNNEDVEFEKKTFIVEVLFYLCKYICYEQIGEKVQKIIRKIESKDYKNRIFDYNYLDKVKKEFVQVVEISKYKIGLKLIGDLEKLDNNYFENEKFSDYFWNNYKNNYSNGFIKFEVVENMFEEDIYNVLKDITLINQEASIFDFKYDSMSAGERKMVDVFSSIQSAIDKKHKSYIVLLDEPEKGFHPEMSRNFIKRIVEHAKLLGKRYNCQFQFIITTHSPFIISDIPKPYIHCMERNQFGIVEIREGKMGLLSNIPDIMKNTFFLNSPFGEMANDFFKKIQKQIDEIAEQDLKKEKINRIQDIINDIDEPTVKVYLQKKMDKRIEEICDDTEKMIEYYETILNNLKRNR